jgi:hypothetical protein
MPEDKQDQILSELKRCAEGLRFGVLTIEFKVKDGVIVAGDVVEERKKLG